MTHMHVNSARREIIRKLHTATHILNYATKQILGKHIWQNGSNIKEDMATLDVTHYQHITQEELNEIEQTANEIVFGNKPVHINEQERGEAEHEHGFTIYQGGAVPLKTLRIVNVGNLDIEACGGLHVAHTSEIHLIKVLGAEKIQDGLVRIAFTVSMKALDSYHGQENILHGLMKKYDIEQDKVAGTMHKFFDQWKAEKKRNEQLTKSLQAVYQMVIESTSQEHIVINELAMHQLIELLKHAKKELTLENEQCYVTTNSMFSPQEFKKTFMKGDVHIFVK